MSPRKPKKPEDRKDEIIRVRVTKKQKAMLKEAADQRGIDVSTHMRMASLQRSIEYLQLASLRDPSKGNLLKKLLTDLDPDHS